MVGHFDKIDAYRIINQSILKVVKDMVPIKPLDIEPPTWVEQHRLVESTFLVAERNQRVANVVVAHNLNQYVNKFYQIDLVEGTECYLDYLIDIDYSEINIAELGGTSYDD